MPAACAGDFRNVTRLSHRSETVGTFHSSLPIDVPCDREGGDAALPDQESLLTEHNSIRVRSRIAPQQHLGGRNDVENKRRNTGGRTEGN